MSGGALATALLLVGTLGFTPLPVRAQLSGLALPWDRLSGQVGQWVRYRIGKTDESSQYLRLAVVGEEKGLLWIELSVSHLSTDRAPGMATRLGVSRGPDGSLRTERMIVSFNGSAPVEVEDPQASEPEAAPFSGRTVPVCREGGGRCPAGAVRFRRLPPEARMTPLGSVTVSPLEITTAEGTMLRYELSERVPLTGLLSADTPQAGRLELDGVGEGATALVGAPVKRVPGSELASALTAATPALSALGKMGMLLDPEARRAAREAEGQARGSGPPALLPAKEARP